MPFAATPRCYPERVWLVSRERAGRADRLGRVRLAGHADQHLLELEAGERLLVQQRLRDAVERAAVLGEQPDGPGVRLVREPGLLSVTQALRLLRERVVVRPHGP